MCNDQRNRTDTISMSGDGCGADEHHTRDSVILVFNGLSDGTSTTGRWTMGVAV